MENKHSKGDLFEHLSNVIMADNGEGELYKMKAICQVYGRSDEDTPEADKEVRNANIARIVKCWNEYDTLVKEKELLIEFAEMVKNWSLPDTNKFWDAHETEPMSYEACYGTNGSRDYFKAKAKELLNNLKK